MTVLAGTPESRVLKSATMRIGVTVPAIGERQALVARGGFARLGPVTLRAGDALMKPRERVYAAGMTESPGRLPRLLVVAAAAFSPQLACVDVTVTTEAVLAQPEECLGEVFDFDFRPCAGGYA